MPCFPFHNDKRENFHVITKARININSFIEHVHIDIMSMKLYYFSDIESFKATQYGSLPKILLSDGFIPFNIKRIVVLTDYDLINLAFKNPVFSTKSGPLGASDPKNKLDYETERTESGLRKFVNDIQLRTGNTKKALDSDFEHIGPRLESKF